MKQQKQSGFAYLMVVTIILGLALIGTLGFVFYQNFAQNKDTVSKTEDSQEKADKDDTEPPAAIAEDKDTFKITEWGIKGIYKGIHPLSYVIDNSGGSGNLSTPNKPTVIFSSKDLSGACLSFAPGNFSRVSAGDKVYQANQPMVVGEGDLVDGGDIKKIGEYYYVYHSHQAACVQDNSMTADATWIKISDDIKDYFNTLEEI